MSKRLIGKFPRPILICVAIISGLVVLISGLVVLLQIYALQSMGNERGKNLEKSYAFMYENYPFLQQWTDSLNSTHALRDTFILSADDTRLHAIYLYSDSVTPHTAVIIHGYTDNAVRMLHIAYLYNHDLHYNVLLPDLRYSGLSGGTHIQMGWNDRFDVIQWMDVANEIFSPADGMTEMVVHGISMGAATTMCISGEEVPSFVNCFVEDCGYTCVWDEFKSELKSRFCLPAFPLLHLANIATDWRYGWNFREASPLEQIKKCQHPMLFIHGADDTFVPTYMGDSLYATFQGTKQYWRVEGAAHAESYLKFKDEYTEIVKNFTDTYNIAH